MRVLWITGVRIQVLSKYKVPLDHYHIFLGQTIITQFSLQSNSVIASSSTILNILSLVLVLVTSRAYNILIKQL